MNIPLPLAQEKKLTVVSRIEPGCLGPDGIEHIDEFCTTAQQAFDGIDADFIQWQLSPRHNKNLPEMQYKLMNRLLSHDKADKYLQLFDKSLDEFETHLHEKLAELIDDYLGH